MTVLHLDSSILGSNSVSRSLSAAALQRVREGAEVVYRDLAAQPLPHFAGADLGPGANTEVLEEFLRADIVVIGVAFYNFGIPSQLKAWVDRIAVAGKTFRYTADGPEGLCGGKRVILAISRGGFYAAGSPSASFEHAESYLKAVFGFLGVSQVEVVVADGVATGPEQKQRAIEGALQAVEALSAVG